MTHEAHKPSPEEMQEIMRVMRVRMRNNALHHNDRIGPRPLRALQDLDLIDTPPERLGDELDPEILRDTKHPQRQYLPPGPLVMYRENLESLRQTVVELPALIYADSQDMRAAALACIDQIASENELGLTPKTVSILAKYREDLLSDGAAKWRPASIAISDALYDDVLVALNGTRQSMESEPVIQDSLNLYSPKLIHPSVSSLDSIDLPIWKALREHEALVKLVAEVVTGADGIAALCRSYLNTLGFVPLAPAFSLAAAVVQWTETRGSKEVWAPIWAWADTETTPLAIYHACTVFVLHPEFVPEGKLGEIWNRILSVVHDPIKRDEASPLQEAWAMRRDLVKHYTFHLEAQLPDNDGTNIGAFAWWFTEKVAALFPSEPEAAKYYNENWIIPALGLSNYIWLLASSPVRPSYLRYLTYTIHCPWAAALLTLMGEQLEHLAPAMQEESVKRQFHNALVSTILTCLPVQLNTPDHAVFAQECAMVDTITKWADIQDDENKDALNQVIATSRALDTPDGLCEAMRKLGESQIADQIATSLALKAKALTDPAIADSVWDVVADADWRRNVLAPLDTPIQSLIVESFSILLIANREKWYAQLPHYLAELCENTEDPKRRQELFLYVIHLSMASDTVSAIRRLLSGPHKAKLVDTVNQYRQRAESLRSSCPPWVASKLRAIMASLHVT